MQAPPHKDNRAIDSLLLHVAQGDQKAFERLYQATSPYIYGVLLRMFRQEAAAEDALQEAFLRIWENAGTYNPSQGKPLTWMTSIARYHALDVLRSNKSSISRDSAYSRLEEQPALSVLSTLETETGDSQILSICLKRIEPEARDCLIDAYCGGYTHQELSEKKGRPLGTVKSWIKRALQSLRECVDELS